MGDTTGYHRGLQPAFFSCLDVYIASEAGGQSGVPAMAGLRQSVTKWINLFRALVPKGMLILLAFGSLSSYGQICGPRHGSRRLQKLSWLLYSDELDQVDVVKNG